MPSYPTPPQMYNRSSQFGSPMSPPRILRDRRFEPRRNMEPHRQTMWKPQ